MKSGLRVLLLALWCALTLQAQVQMNVQDLADFVRSELALKQHKDKQIATYIRQVQLSEKLTDKAILDFKAQGAGPKTVKALEEQRERTAALREPLVEATSSPAAAPVTIGSTAATTPVQVSPLPPPDSSRQQQILDLTKQYALSYTQNLPNFACVQIMRRYFRGLLQFGDRYRNIGTVLTRVSYNEGREDYKVYSVNGHYKEATIESAAGNKGAVSQGEFGSIMREIFQPKSEAAFNWDHWAMLRGKKMAAFNFFIDSDHSGYSLAYSGASGEERRIVTAYRGLIYADENTGEIFRIKLVAADIPKSFPINAMEEILDYDTIDIGGQPYVLPLVAKFYMTAGREKSRNELEFRSYRKFDSQTFVTYATSDISPSDVPPPLPANKTEEQPWWAPPASPPPPSAARPPR
jgi:hypothetical protein